MCCTLHIYISNIAISIKMKKGSPVKDSLCRLMRKVRDSNPRYHVMGIPDFESSAFDHSANLPKLTAKLMKTNVKTSNDCMKLKLINNKKARR